MAASFKLQIVKPNGEVVEIEPGRKLERDLIQSIADRLADKPVGIFRTRAKVQEEVVKAVTAVFMELKKETSRFA